MLQCCCTDKKCKREQNDIEKRDDSPLNFYNEKLKIEKQTQTQTLTRNEEKTEIEKTSPEKDMTKSPPIKQQFFLNP